MTWHRLFLPGLLLAFVAPAAQAWTARPELVLPRGLEEDLRWQAQALAAPVAPGEVHGRAPFVPVATSTVLGEASLEEGEAAAFWLGPLDVVRVKTSEGAVRFIRIPEPHVGEAELQLDETGIAVRKNEFYLAEPPGRGSVWLIVAKKAGELRVERPEERHDALAGEAVRARILAWIDGRSPRPPLTFLAELRTELELAKEIEAVVAESDPDVAGAARAWRKAAALDALARWQPVRDGTFRRGDVAIKGERVQLALTTDAEYVRLRGSHGERTIELTGPSVLSLRVRAVIGTDEDRPRRISLVNGERTFLEEALLAQPAWERESTEAPFPHLATPRLLPTGERIGVVDELRVRIPRGTHRYELAWQGGELLVRAQTAQRKAWTGELISGTAHASGWAREAWKQLEGRSSTAASVLRHRLHSLEPSLSATRPSILETTGDVLPAALAALARAESEPSALEALEEKMAQVSALRPEVLERSPLLEWELRLKSAELLIARGATDRAQRLLIEARAFPASGTMAARAARLIDSLRTGATLRSRELAALELAWRHEPLSAAIRRQYRLAWSRESRWKLLGPDRLRSEAPAPLKWMDLVQLGPGEAGGAGAMYRLDRGARVHVFATGSPTRPTILRAYLLFAPDARGAVTLTIGARRFQFQPLSRVEPVEIALPPGMHDVQLEGEADARAYVSLPLLGERVSRDVAYVHTHWSLVTEKGPVHFRVPDPRLASPVRLHLRSRGQSAEPIVVYLHTDVAPPRRLVLHPEKLTETHFDLQTGAAAVGPAIAVVPLPPLTREVWFTPEKRGADVVAGVSVRQDDVSLESKLVESEPLSRERVDQLHALSRNLRQEPDDVDLLLERAELLVGMDEESHARADLAKLLERQSRLEPTSLARLSALLERLAAQGGDRHTFVQRVEAPTLIGLGGGSLTREDLLEAYREARAFGTRGEHAEAALRLTELYRKERRPELALEALRHMEVELSRGRESRERLAPLAKALTLELSEWADVPALRRVRRIAMGSARWERIGGARVDAGAVHALTSRSEPKLQETLKKALLASPWPLEEGRLLQGGESTVLGLEARSAGQLIAEVLCDAATLVVDTCHWTVRLDGRISEKRAAKVGETVRFELPLARGTHQVELSLGRSRAVGVVRFSVSGSLAQTTLTPSQPLALTRSRAADPVVVEVLGPTALRIRARGVAPGAPRHVDVSWTAIDSKGENPEAQSLRLELPSGEDGAFRALRFSAGPETETTLLLTRAGPHTVRVTPDSGEALLQLDLGVPRAPPSPTPSLIADAPTSVEPLPWPVLAAPMSLLPDAASSSRSDQGFGTVSPVLAVRAEEIGDGEILQRPPRTGVEVLVGLRRELSENTAWLKLQPKLRLPESMAPVTGLDTALFHARLPGRFRTQLQAGSSAQQLDGNLRYALRGSLYLDRPLRLASDWLLLPGASLAAESFSGDGGDATQFDRDVVWQYGLDHPKRLNPSISLRYSPLQDQVASLGFSASTNADLASWDHFTGRLRWSSLLGGPLGAVRASLGYEASYRLEDDHRRESFLRHGVSLRADWAAWNLPSSRLLFFVEDQVLHSPRVGLQNLFSLGVRMDFSSGRGLRDVLPLEEEFEHLLDPSRSVD